jgi:hypothetical protein
MFPRDEGQVHATLDDPENALRLRRPPCGRDPSTVTTVTGPNRRAETVSTERRPPSHTVMTSTPSRLLRHAPNATWVTADP